MPQLTTKRFWIMLLFVFGTQKAFNQNHFITKNAFSEKLFRFFALDSFDSLLNSVQTLQKKQILTNFQAFSFLHNVANTEFHSSAYLGGVFDSVSNRIYFVPGNQANEDRPYWHYVDCQTNQIVSYEHLVSSELASTAYIGGAFDALNHRIYFVPFGQSKSPRWHYIDCLKGQVVSYEHQISISEIHEQSYNGGVYDPFQNRIYFIPREQVKEPYWHYVDCKTGQIVSYLHNQPLSDFNDAGYFGGVLDVSSGRIFFIPRYQTSPINFKDRWHYIDCIQGSVESYEHFIQSSELTNDAYMGGAYDPISNRIYLIPRGQATMPYWHYIDCDLGEVRSYETGLSLDSMNSDSYLGGVYHPGLGQIFLVPSSQADSTHWHYIDCQEAVVKSYRHDFPVEDFQTRPYYGGVLDPICNRIYFIPYNQTIQSSFKSRWHGLQFFGHRLSTQLAAHPSFNKL
jgi:hypothetical protein